MRTLLLLSFAALFSFGASAQQEKPSSSARKKIERIDFSEVHLRGEVKGPTWSFVKVKKKRKFRNLIELRSEFSPELHGSQGAL